ncbi:MAG TPA: hypothetical protein VG965_04640 [Patescibacteria group bacterium]|nr:hypothetical protein [Patescibacteria group bacterium]
MRFSQHFGLHKKQFELDFVDIRLDTDIPLFLDPYAISKRADLFSEECNSIIINFFQGIIDDIRSGNHQRAKANLDKLGEPNETHLGLSRNKPQGKGVSGEQSVDIFDALKESRAVQTGFLKDLSDCELVIPGISRDKISDVVTNIVKTKLIEYTEEQCKTFGINTTHVSSGRYWNPETSVWEERYADLPIYQGKRILLIPKALVRYSIEYNHPKYYNHFVLEYLQEEHLGANTALVTLLKNGNKVVYKKDLKAKPEYKLTKEFLYNFSKEHPDVMQEYIESLPEIVPSLTDAQIETKQPQPQTFDYADLKNQLLAIPSGDVDASHYHNLMVGVVGAIFYPNLIIPTKEERIHNGRKRIDITYQNAARTGFFEYLTHHVPCPFVVCECKNYEEDPGNPELDQLGGRFSPRRGQFGILLCRTVANKDLMKQRCRDTADDSRGFIFVLDDEDICHLLDLKEAGDDAGVDQFLTDKYKELVM